MPKVIATIKKLPIPNVCISTYLLQKKLELKRNIGVCKYLKIGIRIE